MMISLHSLRPPNGAREQSSYEHPFFFFFLTFPQLGGEKMKEDLLKPKLP